MDPKAKEIYLEFISILNSNNVEYSIADLGIWKMVIIYPNKNDLKGIESEVNFMKDVIDITSPIKKEKKIVVDLDELIRNVNEITKLQIAQEETIEKNIVNKKHF